MMKTGNESDGRCSVKKGVLKNFEDFKEKHQRWSFFLIPFFKKEIFKTAHFKEHLRMTASILQINLIFI